MSDDRLITAIGRLERALSRIEATGISTVPAPGDNGLEERHRRLRARTQSAIDRLDRLMITSSAAEQG